MTKGRDFAREQVIEAIGGSGGIMSAIATRLGCAWDTAKRYVNYWESTKQAFNNERAGFLDACESVLERNVQLAMQAQKNGELADTSDVKWVLARLGKDRGYSERREIDLRALDLSQLNETQLERLANGENILRVLATSGTD